MVWCNLDFSQGATSVFLLVFFNLCKNQNGAISLCLVRTILAFQWTLMINNIKKEMKLCAGERWDAGGVQLTPANGRVLRRRNEGEGEMNHLDEKLISLKLKQMGANALRWAGNLSFFSWRHRKVNLGAVKGGGENPNDENFIIAWWNHSGETSTFSGNIHS